MANNNEARMMLRDLKDMVHMEELKARLAKAIYENYYYRYLALQYEYNLREWEKKYGNTTSNDTTNTNTNGQSS